MDSNITTELRPRLSADAAVVLPDDEEFPKLVSRWREWHAPSVAAVVKVANERDVQEAVSEQMCLGTGRLADCDLCPFSSLLDGMAHTENPPDSVCQ
jgi:hypothetical protein